MVESITIHSTGVLDCRNSLDADMHFSNMAAVHPFFHMAAARPRLFFSGSTPG